MASLLERGLEREGHVTSVARDGEEGLDYALLRAYDVVILDVMLPKSDGYEVARRLREAGSTTPVLMLTARDASRDIVQGLDTGADDYLTKPFAFEELIARVRALARRAPLSVGTVLEVGDLKLDPAAHEAWRGTRKLQLTRREFQIVELLARRPGSVLDRDTIIEGVWGHAADVEPNTVDVFVGNLRRKIGGAGEAELLHTVRGVGFCLKLEEP